MKKYLIMLTVVAIVVFGAPSGINAVLSVISPSPGGAESIELLLEESEETLTLTPQEYLVGCLFAQIAIGYEQAALEAQAVAAYTYALRLLKDGKTLSDSSSTCQPFFTEAHAREHYGEEYDVYLPKVQKAAEYGATHVITYENDYIYAVYHSVSSGRTNRAYYIWGVDFPYLQPVDSEWDKEYINFEAENEIATDSMRVMLLHYSRELTVPVDYSLWFSEANIDEYGYVLTMKMGGETLCGGDFWRIFNLRSTAFEISFNGTVFNVATKGVGHGAGLSQYGANKLAEQGKTAEEILEYYYTGVEIVEISAAL